MRAARFAVAALVTLGGLVALGALTRVPYSPDEATASLRLSWRLRAERVQECRVLSEAEQEALPAHMRRERICEGRVAEYRLRVELDGRVVADRVVRPAGARGDRPLYVLEEYRLAPGRHDLSVWFDRSQPLAEAVEIEVTEDRAGRPAAPDSLRLDAAVTLASGDVALVTYDLATQSLVLRP